MSAAYKAKRCKHKAEVCDNSAVSRGRLSFVSPTVEQEATRRTARPPFEIHHNSPLLGFLFVFNFEFAPVNCFKRPLQNDKCINTILSDHDLVHAADREI